jgi:RNA polymerase sigma factor (TIGR02999 family)
VPPNPNGEADITALLRAAGAGDRGALDQVFTQVYQHLRGLARAQRRATPSDTLSTTGLVHEAYLKLVKSEGLSSEDREHFYNLAARAMRQVLIDRARAHGAAKRPEARTRVTLDTGDAAGPDPNALSAELMDLDRALDKLAGLDARLADLVSLRLFAGLEFGEIAALRGVSERTVLRDWRKTRAILSAELGGAPG